MLITAINGNYNSNLNKKSINVYKYQSLNKEITKTISFEAEPYKGITDKKQRMVAANLIIHSASASAATISASMAQAPGSDEIPLSAVTTGMVGSLLKGCYGIPVGTSLCTSAAACAIGFRLGTGWWRHTISFIPGIGNAASSITTFTLHETTGWILVALCEKLLANGKLDGGVKITIDDFKKAKDAAKKLKDEQKNNKQSSSFKGDDLIIKKIKINKLKNLINEDDIIKGNKQDFALFVQEILNSFNIEKGSKTEKEINIYLNKFNNHVKENIFKTKPSFVIYNNDELLDDSLELHYWLLIAVLDKAKKEKQDINNIELSNEVFQNKNILDNVKKYIIETKDIT